MTTVLEKCTVEIRHVWDKRHDPIINFPGAGRGPLITQAAEETPRRDTSRFSPSQEPRTSSTSNTNENLQHIRNDKGRVEDHNEPLNEEHPAISRAFNNKVDDDIIMLSISNTAGRGQGRYICPLGAQCTSSRLDDLGQLVIFKLNSSFR